MSGLEYLLQIAANDMRITAKVEEAYRLRELAERCTIELSERVDSSPKNKREEIYARLIDASKKMDDEANALIDERLRVSEQLNGMRNKRLAELLRLRYMCNKTWNEVGRLLGMNESTLRKEHDKAVAEYERLFLKK